MRRRSPAPARKAQGIAGETRDKLSAEAETKRKTLEAELSAKLSAAEVQIAATKDAAMSMSVASPSTPPAPSSVS